MFGAKTLPSDALEAHAAVAAIAAAAIDERPRGGPLDMRDVEATEAALRQGVRLAHDAANGTKFDAQQQVRHQDVHFFGRHASRSADQTHVCP